MKTNKLLLSLLCASIVSVFAMSCTKTEIEAEPGTKAETNLPDVIIRDTTKMLIPEFGLKMADVCSQEGEYGIEFMPQGDWTFSSETAWLKVVSASGTKNDKALAFKVDANTSETSRDAEATLTVGGVKRNFKVTQMGVIPSIKMFGKTVTFTIDKTEGVIKNVICNREIEVIAKPEWVTSTEIKATKFGYEIAVALTPLDYDSETRNGVITVKVKGSSVTLDIKVICARFSADFFPVVETIDAAKNVKYDGFDAAKRAFEFEILENPSIEESDDELTFVFRAVTSDGKYEDVYPGQTSFAKGEKVGMSPRNSTRAAFAVNRYKVTLDPYTYQFNKSVELETRKIACFLIPKSIETEFDPKKQAPLLTVEQEYYPLIKDVKTTLSGFLNNSWPAAQDVNFLVRKGIKLSTTLPASVVYRISYDGGITPGNPVFPGKYDDVVVTPSTEEGWDLYTYKVHFDPSINKSMNPGPIVAGEPFSLGMYEMFPNSGKFDYPSKEWLFTFSASAGETFNEHAAYSVSFKIEKAKAVTLLTPGENDMVLNAKGIVDASVDFTFRVLKGDIPTYEVYSYDDDALPGRLAVIDFKLKESTAGGDIWGGTLKFTGAGFQPEYNDYEAFFLKVYNASKTESKEWGARIYFE